MTETTQPNKPGFLARLFKAFFKLLLFVIVLTALAIGGWFGYKEIDRSFDSVVTRMDINTRRIADTSSETGDLLAKIDAQHDEMMALQTAVTTQNDQIATLTAELATERTQRDEALAALDSQLSDSIASDVAALNEGMVALQGDITNNGAQIDELGGTADTLQSDITSLTTQLETTEETLSDFPAAEIVKMRQTITLFRIWELTGRARFRLIEGNAGLAAADVESALIIVNEILDNNGEDTLALALQERLTLAASNLPDNPDTAVRDLETAWEALDTALAGDKEQGGETAEQPSNSE